MRILNEAPGYATQENAIRSYKAECKRSQVDPDSMRWVVVVTDAGRFSVAVLYGDDTEVFMRVVHGMKKVCILS